MFVSKWKLGRGCGENSFVAERYQKDISYAID